MPNKKSRASSKKTLDINYYQLNFTPDLLDDCLQIFLNFLAAVQYLPQEQHAKLIAVMLDKIVGKFCLFEPSFSKDQWEKKIQQVMSDINNDQDSYIRQTILYTRIIYDLELRRATNVFNLRELYRTQFDLRTNAFRLAPDFAEQSQETLINRLELLLMPGISTKKSTYALMSLMFFIIITLFHSISSNSIPRHVANIYNAISFFTMLFSCLLYLSINPRRHRKPPAYGQPLKIQDLQKNQKKLLAEFSGALENTPPTILPDGKFITWTGPENRTIHHELGSLSLSIIPLESWDPFTRPCFVYWDWQDLCDKKIIASEENDYILYCLGYNNFVQTSTKTFGYHWKNDKLYFRLFSEDQEYSIPFSSFKNSCCGKYRLYFPDGVVNNRGFK